MCCSMMRKNTGNSTARFPRMMPTVRRAWQPLRIEGKGQLNGKPVEFELSGDPLRTASRSQHYGFSFSERSSGSHLAASGFLQQGFRFAFL